VAALAVTMVGATGIVGQVVAADPGRAPKPQEPVRAVAGPAAEVPALRTEFSRTRRLTGGVLETTLSATPLHFRGAGGSWRAIDNRLERQPDGAFEVAANDVEVSIPDSASGEVRFGEGGEAVAFSLVGASAAPADVSGEVAEYAEVRGDTDLSYEVDGQVLKETLRLASAEAPTAYRFAVDAGGLQPRLGENGDVTFVDADGRQRLGFQAPWMKDAAGAVSRGAAYALERVDGRDHVVLRLDADWLANPARQFPVVVDPTVYSGWEHVCEIRSGARSTTTGCDGALSEAWVGRDSSGIVYRNLYELQDLALALPDYAQILDSWFAIYLNGQSPVESSQIDLHHLVRGFAPGATWNRSDGRALWSRPGGDYAPAALHRADTRFADPSDGWMAFDITNLARRLVSGEETSPNLLVKAADETRAHIDSFDQAEVKVRWHPRTGIAPQWAYESFALSDGSILRQNMANGNLVLSANDLDWETDDGRSATVRYFNAQGLRSGDFGGTFGGGTQGSFGSIRLTHHWLNDSYILAGPSGLTGVFSRDGNGGFSSPEGLDATLTELSDGTFTLVLDGSGETWTFDADGDLAQTRQADGYTVSATWSGSRIQTLSDSTGRSVTATYDSAGDLRTLTDQDRAVRRYDYDGSGRLTVYTSPSGAQTRYSYDSSNRLTCISLPDRTALEIAYHGTTTYPSAITPVDAAGVEEPATSYDGGSDWTSSVHAAEPRTVYFFDPDTLVVDLIEHGSSAAIASSGPIPALDGGYTRGDMPLTVDVSAAQVPDGIQLTELEVDDVEVDSVGPAPCDESTCPARARETLTYDPTFDADGTYEYRVNTVDGDDERTNGPLWKIAIDRTAPRPPSDPWFIGLDPDDPTTGSVLFENARDPKALDGTDGSGVASSHVRYRIDGGSWSDWLVFGPGENDSSFDVPGLTRGSVIDVEMSSTDRVGNTSPVLAERLIAADADNGMVAFGGTISRSDPLPSAPTELAEEDEDDDLCIYYDIDRELDLYGFGTTEQDIYTGYTLRAECLRNKTLFISTSIGMAWVTFDLTDMKVSTCIQMKGGASGRDGKFHDQKCVRHIGRPDLLGRAPDVDNDAHMDLDMLCRSQTRTYRVRTVIRGYYQPQGLEGIAIDPAVARTTVTGPASTLTCNDDGVFRWSATNDAGAGWDRIYDAPTISSQTRLIRNLSNAGERLREARPPGPSNGWHAHHIVAKGFTTRGATVAQAYAYRCGLDPNEASNGVWLRGPALKEGKAYNALPPNLRNRAYHPYLHTNRYFAELAAELRSLFDDGRCTRSEIQQKLFDIRTDLETDDFPYRPAQRPEDEEIADD
jgi:YD repeat-containing protein